MPETNHIEQLNGTSVQTRPAHADGHSTRTTHGDAGVPTDLPRLTWRSMSVIGIVLLALFVGLFLLGWIPESKRQAEARAIANERVSSKPLIDVVRPKKGPAPELLLPGDLRANQSTSLFARASGYLKPFPSGIDIGARVEAGQFLAEIAAPEVDAELEQAKAALQQAKVAESRARSDFEYSKSTVVRYEAAAKDHAVAQQDLADKRNLSVQDEQGVKVAEANVAAAEAAVKRLSETQGFQRVVAPFSGVITARGYDAGALISGTDSSNGKELFHIDQTDVLRMSVSVPQGFVTDIQPGQDVDVLVRNYPGQAFHGKVGRLAGAIDPAARTMRVEIDIPNADGKLVPGMYSNARFHLDNEPHPVVVPTSALVFNSSGMSVAVLDGNKVRFQPVTLGRDFGTEVEIVGGLTGDEPLVNSPSENLAGGAEVAVRPPPAPVQTAGPAPK